MDPDPQHCYFVPLFIFNACRKRICNQLILEPVPVPIQKQFSFYLLFLTVGDYSFLTVKKTDVKLCELSPLIIPSLSRSKKYTGSIRIICTSSGATKKNTQ